MKTVSILGCGWLGLPLAQDLARARRVYGSTTSAEKISAIEAVGVQAFLLHCDPEVRGSAENVDNFFKSDILVITIPFKRGLTDPYFYYRQIESVGRWAEKSAVQFVIMTSSTSVYPETNKVVGEDDPIVPGDIRGKVLWESEQILLNNPNFQTTVVRLAGLYGYDRQPGRFLSGQRAPGHGDAPVNLIHRDDAVGILLEILRQDVRGEIFNACSDGHPARKEFYGKLGTASPEFDNAGPLKFKVVSNRKVKERLGYKFKHPQPIAALMR